MVANELAAAKIKDRYSYLSEERSDRTAGHLWTEKVVETSEGKVRFLLAEDGKPLPPDRVAAERGRLAAIAADPAAFARREQALKDDEAHARQMLAMLPSAFLFADPREQNGMLHMTIQPNPQYTPQSLEERVIHAMSGAIWIDARSQRLHRLEGTLPADLNLGLGLLATFKAGSGFATERNPVETGEWKTTLIDSNVNGRAIFFKTISRRQHTEHTGFHRVPNDITIPQAVALAEQP